MFYHYDDNNDDNWINKINQSINVFNNNNT